MAQSRYIHPHEAEIYIDSLHPNKITDVGSPKWFQQHQLLYKLSLQASLSVKSQDEEFIKDYFISSGKISVVIHELIVAELWKEKIFPLILKMKFSPSSSVPLYTVLYHETILSSLLGSMLFHEGIVESANDVLIDMIDYCCRKLVFLLQKFSNGEKTVIEFSNNTVEELNELIEKTNSLEFFLSMEAISLLSHIARHLKIIPLCVLHRVLNVHDVPVILINLLEEEPWKRKVKDACGSEIFCDGNWVKIQKSAEKLGKIEGQVWISLIQLLLNEQCLRKYEISNYRKKQLLKLRPMINDAILSQIPILEEMLRFLQNISIFEPPPPKPDIVIEQISEIREPLLKNYEKKWQSIAEKQVAKFFTPDKSQLEYIFKGLSDTYDMESLEALLPDKSKCANCLEKPGKKRCSQCKNEWYCGRKCQVQHWPKHKNLCNLCDMKK